MTSSEEESLKEWILLLDKRGAPSRPAHVREMANILLLKRDTTSSSTTVGEKWVYNFTKRTPELKSCFARRYNYQRAKVEDPKVLGAWFEQGWGASSPLEDEAMEDDQQGFETGSQTGPGAVSLR
ncbi:hypothetical protein NYO67_6515, partial [Aspergillus flavus]